MSIKDEYKEVHICSCIAFTLYLPLQWDEGELIISDNLAVGHEATPETQLPVAEVGLRVLHRVTIAGTKAPTK